MRYLRIKSQRGFGIIQAIAGLLIVSIAAVSLFLAAHFSKTRAQQNYHYRLALLKAMDELEMIKWKYPNYDTNPVEISYYTYQFEIDDINNSQLVATLIVDKKVTNDLAISLDTKKATVFVKVTWEEPVDFLYSSQTVTRSIVLQEEYFYRISG